MNRLRSTALHSIAPLLYWLASTWTGPASAQMSKAPVGTLLSITDPIFRQVVQRRDDNVGNILVVGTYSGNVDGFQAMSLLLPGMTGTPVAWTPLTQLTILNGTFIGIFRQPAGGFYDVQVRPMFQGQAGAPVAVYAVGVGEVFLTAGQSNSTSWGTPTYFAPDDRVSCFVDGPGRGLDPTYPSPSWRWAYDPQPAIDQSTGGSVWPIMSNNLALAYNVPIGLYACGCGGTSIQEWLPGHVKSATATTPQMVLFNRLTNAITYFTDRGGVRAILWDQGEADYGLQTKASTYQANLQILINQSRAVTGAPIKWMIAQATTPATTNIPLRYGLEQAQIAVTDNVLTFPGPNTDLIPLPYRIYLDALPVHFNATGLTVLGGWWGVYVYNTPGFVGPGYLSN